MGLINLPSNQIRLTNVSLVRLKKGKKRFELACYKNKVLEYRSGNETDLDNVLQIHNVFLNVSKGQAASTADLAKAFGAEASRDDIILQILAKGELQVGEKERNAQLERTHNEVLDIVAARLLDPRSKRVYTTSMIEKALEQLSSASLDHNPSTRKQDDEPGTDRSSVPVPVPTWTGVVPNRPAKSQALEAIRALIFHQVIPVIRARMRVRIVCPTGVIKGAFKQSSASSAAGHNPAPSTGTVKDALVGLVEQIETQDTTADEWELVGFVEPGKFKSISDLLSSHTKGRGKVDVLDPAVSYTD